MKTLQEAAKLQGVRVEGDSLVLHFSPIPNWYGCVKGFYCPRCEHAIEWEWKGNMPSFTNEETTKNLKPKVTGAELIGWGHRWIKLRCGECKTALMAENFD